MGYAVLEGVTGSVEAVLFPRTLQQVGSAFVRRARVGQRQAQHSRGPRQSLLVDEIQPLNEAGRSVYIKFPTLGDNAIIQACSFLKKHPGKMPVILYDSSKKIGKGAGSVLCGRERCVFRGSRAAVRRGQRKNQVIISAQNLPRRNCSVRKGTRYVPNSPSPCQEE
jgi:hypothetical protein